MRVVGLVVSVALAVISLHVQCLAQRRTLHIGPATPSSSPCIAPPDTTSIHAFSEADIDSIPFLSEHGREGMEIYLLGEYKTATGAILKIWHVQLGFQEQSTFGLLLSPDGQRKWIEFAALTSTEGETNALRSVVKIKKKRILIQWERIIQGHESKRSKQKWKRVFA